MTPFWHPLATLRLADPPALATANLLRMLIGAGEAVRVLYAGDRMWPRVRHGAPVDLVPPGTVERGDVVVVERDGIPDLARVTARDGRTVWTAGDADPTPPEAVDEAAILAATRISRRASGRFDRAARRFALDAAEAFRGRIDAPLDPEETVLGKYDAQAPFYARSKGEPVEPELLERLRAVVPAGRRIVVAGSGAGREAVALARAGWNVRGVDFSKAMVEEARRLARSAVVPAEFTCADLRRHDEEPESTGAVVFTYDVYSFLASSEDRVRTLRRMARWLEPEGRVFLSARRVRSAYQRIVLTAQWVAGGARREAWGATHTRWIDAAGRVRRSYVRVLTERRISREARNAGLEADAWRGGHLEMRLRS